MVRCVELAIDGIVVSMPGLEPSDLAAIHRRLEEQLSQPQNKVKNRDAIADAFMHGLERCPDINPSDLWHHVIYREYVRTLANVRRVNDPQQSWKRSSGDAFEIFLRNYYNPRLAKYGVRLLALFDTQGKTALRDMGIHEEVGSSKLDLSIRSETAIIGGIHAKTSFAERITDDEPASTAMMRKGYLSALVTLDVKSFPPSWNVSEARAYQNRGELGTPEAPSDKRTYIENHGSFDLCVSYNSRTIPSLDSTPSGKRIFTVSLGGIDLDPLEQAILDRL